MTRIDELLAEITVELDKATGPDCTDLVALRDLIASIWTHRGNDRVRIAGLVVALDEALGLADVPERDQDERWYERRKILGQVCDRHERACMAEALAAARAAS